MKKFTLMILATFVAVAGMAMGTQKHAIAKKFVTSKAVTTPAFAKKVDVSGGMALMSQKAKFNALQSMVKDAEPTLDVKSGILASQYIYDEYIGGLLDAYPVEEVAYAAVGDQLLVELNDYMILEGTIGQGENPLAEYGYEVVTFKAGEVMVTNPETGEEFKIKNADQDPTTYELVPNENDIVGYIYVDDAGVIENIFIADIVCLAGDVTGVVMGGANYDIYDCSFEEGAVYVATTTGKDSDDPISNTGKAFYWMMNQDNSIDVLVQGLSAWDESAWFKMVIAADGTSGNIENYQFVGSYQFTNPEGAVGSFYSCGFDGPDSEGSFTRLDDGLTLTATSTDAGDVYTSTGNNSFCAIGCFDPAHEDYSGYIYSALQNIELTITNEPAEPITGIEEVKANKSIRSNAATYNLAGQKVGKDYKGMIIRDGKKFLVK